MAATNPSTLALSEADRQTLAAWLAEFERGWHEGALEARVRELSSLPAALHFPALVEMVKLDLGRQWQRGRRVALEGYLEAHPRLGTPYTAPADLIQAEYEARQRLGEAPDLAEFGRRFPGRTDDLRRLLAGASETTSWAAGDPHRATPRPDSTTHSRVTPPAPPVKGLPEQFGRYRIVRKLGQGGMGTVYLAHDSQFDRPVALKVPHFGPDDGPDVVERFYREAKAAAVLHHPNFCPVYDVGQIDGTPYLTMAYLEGKSLADAVRDGPLPPDRAADLVRTLAAALDEVHRRGVIHRDLKPSNVLLTERGEPVVLDFGLARRRGRGDVRLTQSGALVGTPAYVAPEQLSGKGEPSPSCDIYSLGAMFYELLTGRPPFLGPLDEVLAQVLLDEPAPPSSLRPEVGPALDAVCLKALAKKPADRHASMAEFAAALDRCRSGAAAERVPAAPESVPTVSFPAPPVPLPPRRGPRRWLWVSAAAVLAMILGGFVYFRTGVGTIQILVDVPGAVIVVDDEPAQPAEDGRFRLSVGEHWVVVKIEGIAVAKRHISVSRGVNEPVTIDLMDQLVRDGMMKAGPAVKAFTSFGTDMLGSFGKLVTDSKADMDKRDADWEKRRLKEEEEREKRFKDFFPKWP